MKLRHLKEKTIGLVLSGGGVKGMAHIGIIKALNERGYLPGYHIRGKFRRYGRGIVRQWNKSAERAGLL